MKNKQYRIRNRKRNNPTTKALGALKGFYKKHSTLINVLSTIVLTIAGAFQSNFVEWATRNTGLKDKELIESISLHIDGQEFLQRNGLLFKQYKSKHEKQLLTCGQNFIMALDLDENDLIKSYTVASKFSEDFKPLIPFIEQRLGEATFQEINNGEEVKYEAIYTRQFHYTEHISSTRATGYNDVQIGYIGGFPDEDKQIENEIGDKVAGTNHIEFRRTQVPNVYSYGGSISIDSETYMQLDGLCPAYRPGLKELIQRKLTETSSWFSGKETHRVSKL